jgi:hypothetical protein
MEEWKEILKGDRINRAIKAIKNVADEAGRWFLIAMSSFMIGPKEALRVFGKEELARGKKEHEEWLKNRTPEEIAEEQERFRKWWASGEGYEGDSFEF